MVQSTDLGDSDDASLARRLDGARNRRISIQRQVCARLVVILQVRGQDPNQVGFVERDHVIQTLTSD